MYSVGDFIIYGNDGVCEVDSIGIMNMLSSEKNYYTLISVNENVKIFAPTDTNVFMRPVSTYEEVVRLIENIPSIPIKQFNEKNIRLQKPYYENIIKKHDCEDLLALISGFNDKKIKGKKINQVDEKYKRIAQDLIRDEFAVALKIPRNEVESYIKNQIGNSNISYEGYLK